MDTGSILSPGDLAALLEGGTVVVVDTRPPFFYMQGHLPNAVSLPLLLLAGSPGAPDPAAVAARLGRAGITPATPLVLYDDGMSPTASHAAWILTASGHSPVARLDGGIVAWTQDGRTVSNEPRVRPPVDYLVPELDTSVVATLDDVRAALDDEETVILDVRSPAEYGGLQISAERNGHIPGAINIDWSNNLWLDGGVPRIRPSDQLRDLYESAGVSPDRAVIVHCQAGSRSTFTWLVLRSLGYQRVRNYSAGWQEWGNRQDTPVDEE
jgi:thiosulfate/3-mercaptopyruvate sulfurtransferase